MSYLHCPRCNRAFDLARQPACARCVRPADEVAAAVQRLARATPAELAAAAASLGSAWTTAVTGAWFALRADPEPAPAIVVMTVEAPPRAETDTTTIDVEATTDTTALDAIQITYDVEERSTALGRLAARGDRAISRVVPMITRAGSWGVGQARALLARFR